MTPIEIKSVIDALGSTQAEAARLLGYGSQSRIAELLSGKRAPAGPGKVLFELLSRWPAETTEKLREIAAESGAAPVDH